nr:1,3-beta-glucanosyltransferase [Quercus suber]
MRGFGVASATAAVIAATSLFVSNVVADVDPIVIKGSKFFYQSNGTQFFIRGVAYQQNYNGNGTSTSTSNATTPDIDYTDPLSDESSCMRDIPYLQKLNTNTIRVYAIDPTADHDACMSALQDAGIYVVADLSAPSESINRADPIWNYELYDRYTSVIDTMAKYSNVLGFFAGNEVTNAQNNTDASAFVKAAVRDSKQYIKDQNYRTIGVGYATNDDASIRENLAAYFNCGDQTDAIDFWGYNIYSWCGDSSYEASGYQARTEEFSSYSVPAFFAEYGCNTPSPRKFTDVGTLFGPDMTEVWSGGIVYMYFEEENNFGLVTIGSDNAVTTNQDFSYLSGQIATVSPSGTQSSDYNPTNSPAACPSVDGTTWAAEATPLPKTPDEQLCECMYNSLSCVVTSDTSLEDYGELFGTVCGYGACDGIIHNATTGDYGDFGMCNSTQQLAYAFNHYYIAQDSTASACDFSGAASTQAASTASSCSSALKEAGTAGTGSMSGGAQSTGKNGDSSSTPGAAGALSTPSMTVGIFPVVLLVTLAVTSGFGMIVLRGTHEARRHDAGIAANLLGRGVRISRVHAARGLAVGDVIRDSLAERCECHVDIAHDEHGQAVKRDADGEEEDVNHQLDEIRKHLQREQVSSFLLPTRDIDLVLIDLDRLFIRRRGSRSPVRRLLLPRRRPLRTNLHLPAFDRLGQLLLLHPRLPHDEAIAAEREQRENRQNRKLKRENHHHTGPRIGHDGVDAEIQHVHVEQHAEQQTGGEASMKPAGTARALRLLLLLLFEDVDAALADPAPDLTGEQQHEHGEQPGADVLAEAGHGQQRVQHRVPRLLRQLLELDRAQPAVQQPLQAEHQPARPHQHQVRQDQQAGVRLREVHRRAVEVRPLVEGFHQACCGSGRRGPGVVGEAHRGLCGILEKWRGVSFTMESWCCRRRSRGP